MRLVATGSTPHQRLAIRCVLFERGLSMKQMALLAREVFERAGVPFREDVDLDTQLKEATRDQAARLLLEARKTP